MSEESREKPETETTTGQEAAPGGEAAPGAPAEGAEPEVHHGPEGLTQEELARRVAALGKDDETEAERIAEFEEQRLQERRAKQKTGKKKGLEAAASKRLAKIGEKATPVRRVAVAADADPLLDRTAKIGKWLEKHSKYVGWAIGGALVVALGLVGLDYYKEKRETDASAELSQAVAAQRGRLGDPEKEKEADPDRLKDPTPVFKTAEERRETALKEYREVTQRFSGTGAAMLARLAEAGILLDKKEVDGAIAAYAEVQKSPLGQADLDVRARAMEGLGFAYELKGSLDDALKSFKELEATDAKGYTELGMYHQARVLEAKGEREKAIELLKKLHERITKGDPHALPYVEQVAEDRLRALDPTALPPKATPRLGGPLGGALGGAGGQLTQEQIRRLIEQMQKSGGQGGAPAPGKP